jgi:NADP-dependent 3-hydroxy acid dehydrogenase YdfG
MMLKGKNIWLVGASEGIGAALAVKLAAAGAHVALSARNEQALQALAGTLALPPLVLPLDVTDQTSVDAAWSRLSAEWPNIDMMIYNAGTYEPLDAQHFDLTKIERMVDVNFHGALRVLSPILPNFLTRNAGHIALIGSVAGYRGLPAALGYGASKAAIIHLAENLKADLGATGITVQIINPGFVKTRLTDKNDFAMPFIITANRAAEYIMAGLESDRFEIHFPKRFSRILKFLSLLPSPLYFWLLKKTKL